MMGAKYSGFLSKKISGFLGSVMFLSCLAFSAAYVLQRKHFFTEEAASGNKKSEEKET